MTTLHVRVKNRFIDIFHHDGKNFIEGRKGSRYTISVYNDSYQRRKIVVSVDGLNVMTGDNNWERGYLLEPWQTIDIPGWRKDNNTVNDFIFSSVKGSYNQQNDSGDQKNIGVIGCLVFNEKVKPLQTIQTIYHHDYPRKWWYDTGQKIFEGLPLGGSAGWTNTVGQNSINLAQSDISEQPRGLAGVQCSATSEAQKLADYHMAKSITRSASAKPEVKNSIGTGYGKESTFRTQSIGFEAESSPSETLLLYYDERDGLIRRGVIERPIRVSHNRQPEAFPGFNPDGCPAPRQRYKRKNYTRRGFFRS